MCCSKRATNTSAARDHIRLWYRPDKGMMISDHSDASRTCGNTSFTNFQVLAMFSRWCAGEEGDIRCMGNGMGFPSFPFHRHTSMVGPSWASRPQCTTIYISRQLPVAYAQTSD